MTGGPKPAAMAAALLELIRGEEVDPRIWGSFPDLSKDIPESANIWKLRNACALLHAHNNDRDGDVAIMLRWWQDYATRHALTEKEDLTPHATYRSWSALPDVIAAVIAREYVLTESAEAIEVLNRSNIAHLAIGVTTGPARELVNSNEDDPERSRLIFLDGKPSKVPHWIVQPGKRGLVRDRETPGSAKFKGLDHLHLVSMLYQAAELAPSAYLRNQCRWEWDVFFAIQRHLDDRGANLWGFAPSEVVELRNFIDDPDDALRALPIVDWMNAKTPSLDFEFTRYVDSSVIGRCFKAGKSSTGTSMAEKWDAATGIATIASCDNGFRASGAGDDDVSPQESHESPSVIMVINDVTSVTMSKFILVDEAYRVRTGPGGAKIVGVQDDAPAGGVVSSDSDQVIPVRRSRRKKSLSQKLKALFRKLKDAIS